MSQLAKDNNTMAASWQLYDAERMANERLRQQLAKKDAEIERLIAYSVTLTHQLLDGIIAEAAGQAREQQLREALRSCYSEWNGNKQVQHFNIGLVYEALALPQDTTALEALIARAGEGTKERCAVEAWNHYMEQCKKAGTAPNVFDRWCSANQIRATQPTTLSDLK